MILDALIFGLILLLLNDSVSAVDEFFHGKASSVHRQDGVLRGQLSLKWIAGSRALQLASAVHFSGHNQKDSDEFKGSNSSQAKPCFLGPFWRFDISRDNGFNFNSGL